MKSLIFTFALLLSSLTAFATGDAPESVVDEEICYTATINVNAFFVSGGVEVTGCGETAAEALAELQAGISHLVRSGFGF